MRIAILTTHVPFVAGGAESMAFSLERELRARGHEAEVLRIPFKWYPAQTLMDHIRACQSMDVSRFCEPVDLAIGFKFPAYLVQHPVKSLWLLHQHRGVYDLWGNLWGDPQLPEYEAARREIMRVDEECFRSCRVRYGISRNVITRMERYNGIRGEALYPPAPLEPKLRHGPAEDYFFFPSRLSRPKRHRLVLDALALTKPPLRIVFAGRPDQVQDEIELKEYAAKLGLEGRAIFRDWVSDEELCDLYARCLAVVYPPLDEDYGFVTAEAMLSGKAVLTCSDSGAPLELVAAGETGLVTEPTPDALAAEMERLWSDRALARTLGLAGRARYATLGITWDRVMEALLP